MQKMNGGNIMKKEYQKPEIAFSSFELSESIAAGCEFISNAAYETCALYVSESEDIVFNRSVNNLCAREPAPGYNDFICYDVPSESNNVFSS